MESRWRTVLIVCGCFLLGGCAAARPPVAASSPTAGARYLEPAPVVVDLLTAAPPPSVLVHGTSRRIALLFREAVIELDRIARPFLGLAGYRFDPTTRTSGASPLVTRVEVLEAGSAAPSGSGVRVWRPASDALLDFVRFSPDGRKLSALRILPDQPARIVLFDIASGKEELLDVPVNAAWGAPCTWASASRLLCLLQAVDEGQAPDARPAPVIVEHRGGSAPTRTYTNLLDNDAEDALFEYHFSGELAWVNLDGAVDRFPETRGLLASFDPAPSGDRVIVRRVARPFPRLVPASRFPSAIEVWDLRNRRRLYSSGVAGFGVELDDDELGPRRLAWRPGEPVAIGFVRDLTSETGDIRYQWRVLEEPFTGAPQVLAESDRPFATFGWSTAGTPYFSVRDEDDKGVEVYVVENLLPNLLWQGDVADRYNDAGRALRVDGDAGPVLEVNGRVFLASDGLGPAGPRPFLDVLNLRDRTVTREFTAEDGVFERVIAVLDPHDSVLLTSRETETSPPSLYRIVGDERQLVYAGETPYPALDEVERRLVTYRRADDLPLSATLYLPRGWQQKKPLPTLIWIYPYEFSDREHAGQLDVRSFRFHSVKGPSPLAAVLEGYAVLVNPTVPIVQGDEGPSDDYLEQLVASAEAAVDFLVSSGISETSRIAVGGRSYGAFSTANLLLHSDRFATGIAMSGAYNRTLTPFGFQREKRSFWEATEIYTEISPFFFADRMNEPILLVHGAADPNPGTPTLQAKRFFHALAGEGATVRYVELPYEGHHYWARESVLHAAREMLAWMEATIGQGRPRILQSGDEPE